MENKVANLKNSVWAVYPDAYFNEIMAVLFVVMGAAVQSFEVCKTKLAAVNLCAAMVSTSTILTRLTFPSADPEMSYNVALLI